MDRRTVFCIVEGQTENAVLKHLVVPHLAGLGIDLHAPIVKVGSGRGGVRFLRAGMLYDQFRRFLGDPRRPWVTTLFDYYGLPTGMGKGWGFVADLKARSQTQGAVSVAESIEQEILRRAIGAIDLPEAASRLIPYIQLHELEALFFAEPTTLAEVLGEPALTSRFSTIVDTCGGCESIDDSPSTAPSKRIEALFPGYIKGRSDFAHGPRIARRLSLATVRSQCPRFDGWLSRLEALA